MAKVKAITGGGVQINGLQPFGVSIDIFTAEDSTVWIKSGVRSTDISSYPNAERSISDLNSISQTAAAITTDTIYDFTYANGFLWLLVRTPSLAVRKYNLDGTDTGTEFDISGQTSAPNAITFGDGFFYISDTTNDQNYKYDSDFNFIDQTNATALVVDNAYFDGLYTVQTGTKTMTAASGRGAPASFTLPVPTSTLGVDYRGGFFYAIGDDEIVYQSDRLKTYTGISLDISSVTNPNAITTDGERIWVLDSSRNLHEIVTTLSVGTDIESKLTVGLKENATSSGLAIEHYYKRIK